jgi:hypothetical protein
VQHHDRSWHILNLYQETWGKRKAPTKHEDLSERKNDHISQNTLIYKAQISYLISRPKWLLLAFKLVRVVSSSFVDSSTTISAPQCKFTVKHNVHLLPFHLLYCMQKIWNALHWKTEDVWRQGEHCRAVKTLLPNNLLPPGTSIFAPNGLVFMSNIYSCFVLSRVENYFVIEVIELPRRTQALCTARNKFVQENMGI